MTESVCGLVPVYDNPITLPKVVAALRETVGHVIIIDDGSNKETRQLVDSLSSKDAAHIHVQHLAHNSGKGAAVKIGLQKALRLGFSHALQVDADGQHDLSDIPNFLASMRNRPNALILGSPVFGHDAPVIRRYGRKMTTLMAALEAGTRLLPDTMCGFRIYPVSATVAIGTFCSRMCFDPEIVIRSHWAGIPIERVTTQVRYLPQEEGGVSHFRLLHDNLLHIGLHVCLLLQAPFRWIMRYFKVRRND